MRQKKKRPPSQILFLKDSSTGKILTEHQDISNALSSYYAKLYTPDISTLKPPDEMTFGMVPIGAEDAELLSEEFHLNELGSALAAMKPNKAPGCDGLTAEFFSKFWPLLGPVLLCWATHVVKSGYISGTASTGVLTLIPKKGDPRDLANWRPITLLTVDVKIILKTIANRLKSIITSIIPCTQNGLPGRSIYDSLHVIRDTIALHKRLKIPLYVLSIDQQKAFDRVSHPFLFHLLKQIGLPDSLISTIKAFYSNFKCQVKNVTYLTSPFYYKRGVRQGDPLATMLYVIALQPVLNAIVLVLGECNKSVIKAKSSITAYADDITVFSRHPEVFPSILEIFKQISKYSEAVLNLNKSSIACFGRVQPRFYTMREFHSVPISMAKVCILGVTFSEGGKICPDQWETKVGTAKDLVSTAIQSLKSMSYYDRAKWLNCRIWPRFAYIFKVLQPSVMQIKELQLVLSDAIWLGARHWLSPETLTLSVGNGGINMLSIADKISTYRIKFMCRCITKGPGSQLFDLAEHIFDQFNSAHLGFRVLHMVYDESRQSDLPVFYQTILKAWNKLATCFFPASRQTLVELPCFNSKPLQEMLPNFGLTAAQAFMYRTFTIEQFVSSNPRISTRTQDCLRSSMLSIIEDWEQTSTPKCQCMTTEKEFSVVDDVKVPTFYLSHNGNFIHFCSWTNKMIYQLLLQENALGKTFSPIWKPIKSSIAPAVYRNRFWRLMHGAVPSSLFLHQIGALGLPMCALCGSEVLLLEHQFRTCVKQQLALQFLQDDINVLGLHINDAPFALFTETTSNSLLANLLIMAFVYSTIELVKSCVSSGTMLGKHRVKDNYILVLAKHIVIQTTIYPPSIDTNSNIWSLLSFRGLLVKLAPGNGLLIRSIDGYRSLDDTKKSLCSYDQNPCKY